MILGSDRAHRELRRAQKKGWKYVVGGVVLIVVAGSLFLLPGGGSSSLRRLSYDGTDAYRRHLSKAGRDKELESFNKWRDTFASSSEELTASQEIEQDRVWKNLTASW